MKIIYTYEKWEKVRNIQFLTKKNWENFSYLEKSSQSWFLDLSYRSEYDEPPSPPYQKNIRKLLVPPPPL